MCKHLFVHQGSCMLTLATILQSQENHFRDLTGNFGFICAHINQKLCKVIEVMFLKHVESIIGKKTMTTFLGFTLVIRLLLIGPNPSCIYIHNDAFHGKG